MAGNSSSWRDSVIEIPPPEKKSILEKFKRNQTMPIPHDYFLYTCLEHLKTEASQGRLPVTHGSQALTKIRGDAVDDTSHENEFEDLVSDCLTYYLANNPEMFTDGPIYFEHLMEFVSPLTWLMDEYVAIIEYCFKRQPLAFGTDEGDADWSLLDEFFQQKIPQRSQYVFAYLTWFFGESKLEAVDLKSMPPVGRFAPPPGTKFMPNGMVRLPPRSSYDRSKVLQGGNTRRPSGPRGNGPRPGGNRSGGNDRGGPRNERGGGNDRNDRGGPRQERGGNDKFRKERNQGGGKFERGPRFLDSNKGHNPAEEAEALKDVQVALQAFQNNPDLQDYLLKPTNSFFRRIQHQEVAAAGFSSRSEGEGKDRALKILRSGGEGSE